MNGSLGLMLLLQIILIALNAVFACAEIAVISMNDAKMEKLAADGDQRARRLIKLTSRPAEFLATIQVAITLSGFMGSAFAAENFSGRLVQWLVSIGVGIPENTLESIAVVLITLALSYFTLVLGELVPKRAAQRRAETLALVLSGLISAIAAAFRPVVWLLTVSTNAVLRMLGVDPNAEDDHLSEEEIRMMVDAGSKNGAIDHEEKQFIQNVFEFDDLTAGEIATHRTDVDLLLLDDSDADWAETIHQTRHTRYPVCRDSADHVVGILNAKDYFRLMDRSRNTVLSEAVRPAYFVPESIRADVLFRNMKRSRSAMAVVLDEYGGMVGVITMNDLVEQLVGDLSDDAQSLQQTNVARTGENAWSVSGNAALEDVERAIGLSFHSEYETFTGLVFNALSMIPDDGDQHIELEIGRAHILLTRVREHQIQSAAIRLTQSIPSQEVTSDE